MKKYLAISLIAILCGMAGIGWAADTKLSELDAATAVTSDDLLLITDSPASSPASKKITVANFAATMPQPIPLATAGGTAQDITADFTPDITVADGLLIRVVAAAANTAAAPTLAPDGGTARNIVRTGGAALVAGDIAGALHVLLLQYNLANTRWELLNPAQPPASMVGDTLTSTNLTIAGTTSVKIKADDEDLQVTKTGANGITVASSTGVDTITLQGAAAANAMNLATSGYILGAIRTIDMGTGATYTLAAADAYGVMLLMTDTDSVTTVALPDYQAAAAADHAKIGAAVCVLNLQAQATIIAPSADDKIRTNNGTLNAGAATVTGPATIGAFSCFVLTDSATDVGHWTQMGLNGAWPVTP
jgi:hypothetical protein